MASQNPFPLMPPKSTELRLDHFDENAYRADPTTILYKFVDAMCGDAGAGSLKKEIFIQRLSGALDGIYGSDLDYIFGNVRFLSRATSESYTYNPMTQMLTSDQWDEVAAKDAQYRARIREFFKACDKASTTEGIRQAVHAATSADCQVMENWRYIDNFGLAGNVGRTGAASWAAVQLTTGHSIPFPSKAEADTFVAGQATPAHWDVRAAEARSELTVVPHKASLHPREARMLVQMLDKITPSDTVVTLDPNGLQVSSPVTVRAITADSTYFQVEKIVTGAPVLNELPAPEMLAIDLDPSEQWLKANSPELAPYGQFNITQEYGYYYLVSGGNRSPIDEVSYGTLQADGKIKPEPAFEWYEQAEQFGPWTEYEKADAPENYPGGKYGLTPSQSPALNPDRSAYQFPYASQADYVAKKKAEVIALGGNANDLRYQLPIERATNSKRTYTPDLAIAYTAPVRESSITSSWTSRKPRYLSGELRNPSLLIRS